MSSRFGGVPAKSNNGGLKRAIQVVMLVMGLLVIFLLVKILNDKPVSTTVHASQPTVAEPEESASPISAIDIAVARIRIEEGMLITEEMLESRPESVSKLPAGAIAFEDRGTELKGRYATRLIESKLPVLSADVSVTPPVSEIIIPPGYRAISIKVDSRSGVEGWARPNSRVDVMWTFIDTKDNQRKVHTLVRFVKVLSVGGATKTDGGRARSDDEGTVVTILVTEDDARKVELARTLGELSLALVGNDDSPEVSTASSGPVSIETILGNTGDNGFENVQEEYEGEMYSVDAKGRQIRWVLVNGRWKRAAD